MPGTLPTSATLRGGSPLPSATLPGATLRGTSPFTSATLPGGSPLPNTTLSGPTLLPTSMCAAGETISEPGPEERSRFAQGEFADRRHLCSNLDDTRRQLRALLRLLRSIA